MKDKPKPRVPDKADDKTQSERFIEAAREHDVDETGKRFDKLMRSTGIRKRAAKKTTSQ
jgi:hypothetical protein